MLSRIRRFLVSRTLRRHGLPDHLWRKLRRELYLLRNLAHLSIPLTIIFAKTDRYGFQQTSYGTTDLISWLRLGFRRGF
ncbi:hypothetical protein, partial [Thiolapillus sp.]